MLTKINDIMLDVNYESLQLMLLSFVNIIIQIAVIIKNEKSKKAEEVNYVQKN